MKKSVKQFILGITLFTIGILSSGLFIISNSITLAANQNNLIPIIMFIVMIGVGIAGLVIMLKNIKKDD